MKTCLATAPKLAVDQTLVLAYDLLKIVVITHIKNMITTNTRVGGATRDCCYALCPLLRLAGTVASMCEEYCPKLCPYLQEILK
jgi:hypothetical protein